MWPRRHLNDDRGAIGYDSTFYVPMTASEKFWRRIRLMAIGIACIAGALASIALYRYNADTFLLASGGFTMVYTLLTLYASMRGQSPYVNNRPWCHALEVLSYFQAFNTFFVLLCVLEMTFRGRSRGRPGGGNGGGGNGGNGGGGDRN